ncbi:hypothetical protein TNCV_2251191 [Trichonephila clavipes]|nr:hypothetical protein TNCV_2251191 [Trichonephila clavipes]
MIGHPACFQAKKFEVPDDVRLASVEIICQTWFLSIDGVGNVKERHTKRSPATCEQNVVVHVLPSGGKASFVFKFNENTSFLSVAKGTRNFVTRMILRVGRYLSHTSYRGKLFIRGQYNMSLLDAHDCNLFPYLEDTCTRCGQLFLEGEAAWTSRACVPSSCRLHMRGALSLFRSVSEEPRDEWSRN